MKKTYHLKPNKGFTLIELLIVIVIIGILSAFLTVNFVGVRERARDSQRKSDLRQVQAALEMYRADNGAYPSTGAGYFYPRTINLYDKLNEGKPKYFADKLSIPADPLWTYCGTSTSPDHPYLYYSNGSVYSLYATLENKSDPDGTPKLKSPPHFNTEPLTTTNNYTITFVGGVYITPACDNKVYDYWVNNP